MVKVPDTIKINLSGTFIKGVFARDVILDYIGKVGEDGANYKALEWKFSNEYVRKQFSMDSRACISNASMECGAKISVFSTDQITDHKKVPRLKFWNNRDRKNVEIQAGASATYEDEFEIECNKIEPKVSGPDNIDRVHSVDDDLADIKIDQAFYMRWQNMLCTDSILIFTRRSPRAV
jgi:3-isopropylmalate/(R)-2-methylmalate dehydratase large subunit